MIVRESISHFTRGGDPKKSLVIGSVALIHQFFDKLEISRSQYEIDDDLNIFFRGDLDLRRTQITHLPDRLSVRGFLDLAGVLIANLPSGLSVGGWLDLNYTRITHLPDDLSAKKIWVEKGQLKYVPEHLKNQIHVH
jgi:hypothetical protein